MPLKFTLGAMESVPPTQTPDLSLSAGGIEVVENGEEGTDGAEKGVAVERVVYSTTPLPSIIALREALTAIIGRLEKGRDWLLSRPQEVKGLPISEAPQCKGCGNPTKCGTPERVKELGMELLPGCVQCLQQGYCPERKRVNALFPEEERWQALTATGRQALELYQALARANRYGTRILAADHLITKYEGEGDDAAVAHCLLTLTEEWGHWERAQREVGELSEEG